MHRSRLSEASPRSGRVPLPRLDDGPPLLRPRWGDDRRHPTPLRRRLTRTQHLTAIEALPHPEKRSPGRDRRVQQVLAMLVGPVVVGRADGDQLASRRVTVEVQRRLGRAKSVKPVDEIVAVAGPLRPPLRDGELGWLALVLRPLDVVAELRGPDQRGVGVSTRTRSVPRRQVRPPRCRRSSRPPRAKPTALRPPGPVSSCSCCWRSPLSARSAGRPRARTLAAWWRCPPRAERRP